MKPVTRVSALLLCLFTVLLSTVYCQQPSGTRRQTFSRVTIPDSQVRTIRSTSTGRDYDLYIGLPSDYEQTKNTRYPVLYILDGQWDFKLMDSVVGGLVYDKVVPQMILVGIAYSGEKPDYGSLRAMDDTPIAVEQVKGSGDGPKFLKFLKAELIPFIEANYRADPSRRVLQGSSYGGLFTLYALFADPGLFSRYLAGSPDVTYAHGYIFRQEAKYARTHKEMPVKLFLAVGGSEDLAGPVRGVHASDPLAWIQRLEN